MSRLVHRCALTAGIIGAVLAGCGITNPYATHRQSASASAPTGASTSPSTTSTTSTTPSVNRVHADDPSEPAAGTATTAANSRLTAPRVAAAPSPQAALARYTSLYINWSTQTIGEHQRELAQLSDGTARANALQAAASYGYDTVLANGHVSNRGQIVSLAAGQGPERGWWVIVTREHTTGQGDYNGLPATTHVTYAQLSHAPTGWPISQWSPQS